MSPHERIALTNYIAAELRSALPVLSEVYVKWWYDGAFNGAAWITADRHGADIFFYPRGRGNSRGAVSVEIPGGHAVIHSTIAEPQLREIVSQGIDALEKAKQAGGIAVLSSVARLQAWVTITTATEEEAARALETFCAQLAEIVPASIAVSPISPLPGPERRQWQADADATLHASWPHDQLLERLSRRFHGLEGSLFGGGTTWISAPLNVLLTARHR